MSVAYRNAMMRRVARELIKEGGSGMVVWGKETVDCRDNFVDACHQLLAFLSYGLDVGVLREAELHRLDVVFRTVRR